MGCEEEKHEIPEGMPKGRALSFSVWPVMKPSSLAP